MSHRPFRFAAVAGLVAGLLLPVVALAHPLGNFTINHYAGLHLEPDRIVLDIVIDQAEIPAFQARLDFDADGDGSVSDEEIEAGRGPACRAIAGDLHLTADGASLTPDLLEAGLSFPLGASGLSTMRLVCGFAAVWPRALESGARPIRLAFDDASFPERLGWREIGVYGSGVAASVVDGTLRDASPSARLTAYPQAMVTRPLDDRRITLDAAADATVATRTSDIPDAAPLDGASVAPDATATGGGSAAGSPDPGPVTATPVAAGVASVPGGVGGIELPSIFRTADLTPVVLLLSVVTAAALGAGHALTPGHGKTLMAAYLVGTRGRPLHAVGLGLSVSVSHTLGILVLAAIVVGAADVLPPDVVVRAAPVVAALSIVLIGGWMLAGEWRRRRSASALRRAHEHAHAVDAPHDHDHEHEPAHTGDPGHEHRHGGTTHSHLPRTDPAITWRGLFALGLAGGLIPSTSALLILLGSIAAGRPAFGLVLVVAFGLGMAVVMGGIGLIMVVARERLDRLPGAGGLGRIRAAVPLVAALLVFGFGIYLTAQAIGGAPTF